MNAIKKEMIFKLKKNEERLEFKRKIPGYLQIFRP